MLLGLILGLSMLGLVFLYVLDNDRKAAPLFVVLLFVLMVLSVKVGFEAHTQYQVKQQVKPVIKVITENGKSDTTYIYKFEEEK